MKLKPIGPRVVIQTKKEPERTESGLFIPESAREEKQRGDVVAVGQDDDGNDLPLSTGDEIIYGGYSDEEIEIDGSEYIIVDYDDVLAKIE